MEYNVVLFCNLLLFEVKDFVKFVFSFGYKLIVYEGGIGNRYFVEGEIEVYFLISDFLDFNIELYNEMVCLFVYLKKVLNFKLNFIF